jgi:predicted TIM-barrel fold metal-dependent hydrolase
MQHPVTRRQFCRQLAGGISAAVCSSPLTLRAEPAASAPVGRYIDIHTHLGQTWNSTKPLSAKELLGWMDANDIAQAVVLPLASPESSSYLLTPDFVLAETKPHRDRLIPFCSIDPRTSYVHGRKGLTDMLRRYVDAGAKGFGEHKPGVKINDPRNQALYAACGELELPVLFHLDNVRNTDQAGLPGLEEMLRTYTKTNFIGHANGWWASISGGITTDDLGKYPKTPVQPGGAIDRLMDKYPNLYGDLSAGSGANAIMRDLKFGREFLIRRADRLMFGTDFLSPGQNVPQLTLYRQLELPVEVQTKIFRGNAQRLLKLS